MQTFKITIKMIDGRKFTMQVNENMTFMDIKCQIAERVGAPPERQALRFGGSSFRFECDDTTLVRHGIATNAEGVLLWLLYKGPIAIHNG